ncbi:MAG: TetR/AcrR family transcriptional regulator [Actinomycetota bacterium]|nr:TetR/AcrR family transcriptional regulator [Actinomycetota bacterium]
MTTDSRTTHSSRPRRADAERNRTRILRAASELFAERGPDASMPELAERAGVGVGSLYRAFGDKEQLLGAVIAERMRWFAGQLEQDLAAPDAWGAFEAAIWKGAALQVKDRALHRAAAEALAVDEVREAKGAVRAALAQLIERAQAQGSLRADVRADDIPMLLDGVGLTHEAGPEARWERHLAIVIDGLRAHGSESALPREPMCRGDLDAILRELPCPT